MQEVTFAMSSKIKICGLFREQDIEYVNEALPDFIGFVFAEKSKRYVNFNRAENLRKNLSEKIVPVGVFVNEKIENIVALYENGVINMVQLHGRESDEYVAELRKKCDAKIIRAYIDGLCDYVLLDGAVPGSGQVFDWSSLRNRDLSNVFLAGGINLNNIKEALALNPFAVDISSGAETNGFKDREKIFYFTSYEKNQCGYQ